MLPALPHLRPVRVLLAPLLALCLAACMPTQPIIAVPTFQVQSVRLTGLTLPTFTSSATAYLTLQLSVNNPNPIPLHMANVAGNFVLDGNQVAVINLPDVDLPARGSATQQANLTLPVTLTTAASFLKVARGQQVSYRLDGTFTADFGLLGRPSFGPFTLVQGVIQQPAILP